MYVCLLVRRVSEAAVAWGCVLSAAAVDAFVDAFLWVPYALATKTHTKLSTHHTRSLCMLQMVNQRAELFSIFLVIPTGFLRALASKQVQLDEDGESDDDSEVGEGEPAPPPPPPVEQSTKVRETELKTVVGWWVMQGSTPTVV